MSEKNEKHCCCYLLKEVLKESLLDRWKFLLSPKKYIKRFHRVARRLDGEGHLTLSKPCK